MTALCDTAIAFLFVDTMFVNRLIALDKNAI